MLEPLTDLPDGVIGFTAVGKLQAEDYRDVLVPAITEVLADGRKVRIVLVFAAAYCFIHIVAVYLVLPRRRPRGSPKPKYDDELVYEDKSKP